MNDQMSTGTGYTVVSSGQQPHQGKLSAARTSVIGTINHQPNAHQVVSRATLQYQPQPIASIGTNMRNQPVAGTFQQQQRLLYGASAVGNNLQQQMNAGKLVGLQPGTFNQQMVPNKMVASAVSNHTKLPLLQPKPPMTTQTSPAQAVQVNQANQLVVNSQRGQIQSSGLVVAHRSASQLAGVAAPPVTHTSQRQVNIQPQHGLVASQIRCTESPLNQIAASQSVSSQVISRPPSAPSAMSRPSSRHTPTPTHQQQALQQTRQGSQVSAVSSALNQVLLSAATSKGVQPTTVQQQRGMQPAGTVHHHSVVAKPDSVNQTQQLQQNQLLQQLQRQTVQQHVPAVLQNQRVNVGLQQPTQIAVSTSSVAAGVTFPPTLSPAMYRMCPVSTQLVASASSQLVGTYSNARLAAQQPQVRQVAVMSAAQQPAQWSNLQAHHVQQLVGQQQIAQPLQARVSPTVQQTIQPTERQVLQTLAPSGVQQVRQIPATSVQQPVYQLQLQMGQTLDRSTLQTLQQVQQSQLQTVQQSQAVLHMQPAQLQSEQQINQTQQQSQLQTIQCVQQSQLQVRPTQSMPAVQAVQQSQLQIRPAQSIPAVQAVQQSQLQIRPAQNIPAVQAVQQTQQQANPPPQVATAIPPISLTQLQSQMSSLQKIQQTQLQLQREQSQGVSAVQTAIEPQLQIRQTQTIQHIPQPQSQRQGGQTQVLSAGSVVQTVTQPQLQVKQQHAALHSVQQAQPQKLQEQLRHVQTLQQSQLQMKPAQTMAVTQTAPQTPQSIQQSQTIHTAQQTQLQVKQQPVVQQRQVAQPPTGSTTQQVAQQPAKQVQVGAPAQQLPVVQLQTIQTQPGQGQPASVQQVRLITSSGSSFQLQPNQQQVTLIQLQPGQQGQQFQTQTADGKVLQFRLVTGSQGTTGSNIRPLLFQGGAMKSVVTSGLQIQNVRGLKRPATEALVGQPVKLPTGIHGALYQEKQAILQPNCKTAFSNVDDAIRRLLPYHLCDQPESDPAALTFDRVFEVVSKQLLTRQSQMTDKHRLLLFKEAQLDATSSEKVMASRMFLADEKQQLAHDKQQLMDEKQKILNEMNPEKQETTDTLSESAKGSV